VSPRSPHKDFLEYWSSVKPQLDEGCRRWIPELSRDLPSEQWKSVYETLEAGKRIRGCLVCLISEALGGKIEDAIPRAVAIECIQAASLIHDDYVDQDRIRRDRPATWTLEGPRKAVLLGDLIFATAIQKLMEMSREDGLVITQAIATMAKGVYQEPHNPSTLTHAISQGTYRPELYNDIIRLKTGALFGTASKLGAVAAQASGEEMRHAFEFGARLGEAYQLADDLHEVMRLGERADDVPTRMVGLAPVFLYFSPERISQLLPLLAGAENGDQEWIANALPALATRMRQEIQVRLELAIKEIKGFPNNPHTRLLRAAPLEVVRMQEHILPTTPDQGGNQPVSWR
jgi:geranylgeranyl pyrophosphate synthase